MGFILNPEDILCANRTSFSRDDKNFQFIIRNQTYFNKRLAFMHTLKRTDSVLYIIDIDSRYIYTFVIYMTQILEIYSA